MSQVSNCSHSQLHSSIVFRIRRIEKNTQNEVISPMIRSSSTNPHIFQPFPISSRRFLFLILSFIFSWLLLATSTLNFIFSTASFFGQRNPSQLVSVPIKPLNLDYPDYDRGKRESILTALFNDPDYDFDKIEEIPEERTTTTTPSPFITETTRRIVPIGGEERRGEGGGRGRGDPMVVVTHNGDIDENGQSREKELIDPIEEENEGDDEEYIEGDDSEDEETTDRPTTVFRARLTTSRPTVSTTEATVPSTRVTVPPTRSTIPPFPEVTPHWVSSIGEGEEWNDILLRGENLSPATTRKISIQRVTTTHVPSTQPSTTTTSTTTTTTQTTTTRRPTTTRTTTTTESPTTTTEEATTVSVRTEFPDYPSFDGFEAPTTTESTTLGTTTKMVETRRPVQSRLPPNEEMPSLAVPESIAPPPSVDYSPFDRFDPTLNGIPSLSSSNPSLSNDLPDYISFNDVDAIPIQIGHISSKGTAKSGRPNLSLVSNIFSLSYE